MHTFRSGTGAGHDIVTQASCRLPLLVVVVGLGGTFIGIHAVVHSVNIVTVDPDHVSPRAYTVYTLGKVVVGLWNIQLMSTCSHESDNSSP